MDGSEQTQTECPENIVHYFHSCHLRPLVVQLQPVLRVGDALISPSSVVRNLGGFLDSGLTMLPHISRTVQGVFGAIKNISRIRRYADDNTCARIVYIRKTGERAFAVCASSRWNSLPAELRQCDSLASFKRQLKTHFFNDFFNVNDVSDDTSC